MVKQKVNLFITTVAAAMIALALASCAPITENANENFSKNNASVTITLPKLGGSSSIRALSEEQVSRLQNETVKFRITFKNNGMTTMRETTGGPVTAVFEISSEVKITVECLNAKEQVIVRSVEKTITMKSGVNSVSFKLSEDGEEIIPENGDDGEDEDDPDDPVTEKFSVSYALDGGEWSATSAPPQTTQYTTGDTVTVTANVPTKQGFTFLGWKASLVSLTPSGGGDTFAASSTFTMPSAAVTFTAQWTNRPVYDVIYDLGFVPDSGSQTSTVQVAEDASVSLAPPSAVRKGYTFKQWLYNGAAAPSDLTMSTSTITLTAEWNIITYTITYDPDGGNVNTGAGATEFDVNTGSINLPQADGKTGYSFDYWKTADDTNVTGKTGEQLAELVPRGSTTLALTAVWTAIQYTITYDANGGGNNPTNTTFTMENSRVTFASSSSLQKQGYSFRGWMTTADGTYVSNITNPADLIALMGDSTTLELRANWDVVYKTDKPAWAEGDIIIQGKSDNSVVAIDPLAYASRDLSIYGEGVAIVYKNYNGMVYIVGTQINTGTEISPGTAWCNSTVEGFNNTNIADLKIKENAFDDYTVFEGYDGDQGLGTLQGGVSDAGHGADDPALETNYPAWYVAWNYGKLNSLKGDLETGWYFPNLAELYDIYKVKDTVDDTLHVIDSTFTTFGDIDDSTYWSASIPADLQDQPTMALALDFSDGNTAIRAKDTKYRVCAVYVFRY